MGCSNCTTPGASFEVSYRCQQNECKGDTLPRV